VEVSSINISNCPVDTIMDSSNSQHMFNPKCYITIVYNQQNLI